MIVLAIDSSQPLTIRIHTWLVIFRWRFVIESSLSEKKQQKILKKRKTIKIESMQVSKTITERIAKPQIKEQRKKKIEHYSMEFGVK